MTRKTKPSTAFEKDIVSLQLIAIVQDMVGSAQCPAHYTMNEWMNDPPLKIAHARSVLARAKKIFKLK